MDFPDLLPEGWNWTLIWAACLLAMVLLVLVVTLVGAHPWAHIAPDRIEGYGHEQCETVDTSGVFVQGMNFWSNFSYLAAGLYILTRSSFAYGKVIGVVMILLAITSGWFHGTLSGTAQTADIMGVYAALLAMIAYAVVKVFRLSSNSTEAWLLLFLGIVLGCVAGILRTDFFLFDSDVFTPILVIALFGFMVSEAIRSINWSQSGFIYFAWKTDWKPVTLFAGIAFLSGLVACAFKFTDGDKNLFAPYNGDFSKCIYDHGSVLQGHGVWHILSGVMFLGIFEYIRVTSDSSS
jgi:hypothetical protein